jgi:hypothetical protein
MILVTRAEPGQSSGRHPTSYAKRRCPSRIQAKNHWFAAAALSHQECHGVRPNVVDLITAISRAGAPDARRGL